MRPTRYGLRRGKRSSAGKSSAGPKLCRWPAARRLRVEILEDRWLLSLPQPGATGPILADSEAMDFIPHLVAETEDRAEDVFTTDFDTDGDVDILAVIPDDDTVAWYENSGRGEFTSHIITTSATKVTSVVAADVDCDGDVDVVSSSEYFSGRLIWHENDGTFGFTPHVIDQTGHSDPIAAGDIDGDGDVDLIWNDDPEDSLRWFENDGAANFTKRLIHHYQDPWEHMAGPLDFDKDGDVDLVVASPRPDMIAWFDNDGDETFTLREISTQASAVGDVYPADLDGDGDIDVLEESSAHDSLAWHRNEGDFSFTRHVISTTLDGAGAVLAADFDGDGDLDVAAADVNDELVVWFENDGSGNLSQHVVTDRGTYALDMAADDLDGDGDPDIVCVDPRHNAIVWYESAGPGQISGRDWHDLDRDGVPDADEPGLEGWTVYLDQNNNKQLDPGERSVETDRRGDYRFTSLVADTYYVREVPQAGWDVTFPSSNVHVVELNTPGLVGDKDFGKDAEIDYGDAPSPSYPTLATGGDAGHVVLAGGPTLGALIDVDADGQPSPHATGDDDDGLDDEDGMAFGLPIRPGQLGAEVTVTVQNAPEGAKLDAWIDFNRDGSWGGPFDQIADSLPVVEGENVVRFDVPNDAVAGTTYARFRLSTVGGLGSVGMAPDGEVEDYELSIGPPLFGPGLFGEEQTVCYDSGKEPESIYAIDVDGDGDMDMVASWAHVQNYYGTYWYENDGAQTFTAHYVASSPESRGVFPVDLDGDGDIDIIRTHEDRPYASPYDHFYAWHENDGQQNFTKHEIAGNSWGASAVVAADFDGDGDLDILGNATDGDLIPWFENDGTGQFTQHLLNETADAGHTIFAVDFDADGDVDAISSEPLAWHENDGGGHFATHTIAEDSTTRIFPTDLDRDGDVDILFPLYGEDNDAIAWYENDGNENLSPGILTTTSEGISGLSAADLDGDGDTDVLRVSTLADVVAWYENDGSQQFTEHLISAANAFSTFAADMDSDGDLDVLAGGWYWSYDIAWYENIGPWQISGRVWYDENENGDRDDGEPPLVGWRMFLDQNDNGRLDPDEESATCDEDGYYGFLNLVPDTYQVRVVVPPDWSQTSPGGTGAYVVDLTVEPNVIGFDFGIYAEVDFGDAPASYSTLLWDDGARHTIVAGGPILGTAVDHEIEGQPSAQADGDDGEGTDDEDGVALPSHLFTGQTASLEVTASAPARLDAWIDFNDDGDWDEPGERVFDSEPVVGDVNSLSFDVPEDAVLTAQTFARFRLSSAGGLSCDGPAADGEVEDYEVGIHWWTPAWWSPPDVLSDDGDGGSDRDPRLITDGSGIWIAVWGSDDGLEGTIGTDWDILFSRSTDAGLTWTDPQPLNTNAATDEGHDYYPEVTPDGAGNWLAVWTSYENLGGTIGTDADLLFSLSNDAGLTWTAPAVLNTNAATDGRKDHTAQVTTDGAGNWVAVWHSSKSFDAAILCSRSTDGGHSWSDPAVLNSNAATESSVDCKPWVAYDGAGTWVTAWRSNDDLGSTIGWDDDILFARSTDGGQTWTDVAPLNTDAATDLGDDSFPWLGTDGFGNFVAVWSSNNDRGGTVGTDGDIVLSRSTDGGQTWSEPAVVNPNAEIDSGYDELPQAICDGSGNWVVVWYSSDSLNGTIGADRDVLFSRSTDGGWTWTLPAPVSTNAAVDSGDDSFPQVATDGLGHWAAAWWSTDSLGGTIGTDNDILFATAFRQPTAEVVGRHVFYNDSKWDESPGSPGGDPAANQYDDDAIAPDKTALLPGETAAFPNYTSYSKGVNGIMVDIMRLPGTLTPDDFEFRMGNDDDPANWAAAPDPSITVRPGEGVYGSDRVTLIWPNYDTVSPDPTTQAVAKGWLQVTVKVTPTTGLTQPDVFYFGNALGDSGLGNFGDRALVNAVDSGAVRDNPHNPFVDPPPLDHFADYNRDQWVGAVDFGLVRDNATNPMTALKLITAPAAGPLPGPEEAPSVARIDRGALHDTAFAELDTASEALADAEQYLLELSWLDGSDLLGRGGRSSRVIAPARAAVEELLATLR